MRMDQSAWPSDVLINVSTSKLNSSELPANGIWEDAYPHCNLTVEKVISFGNMTTMTQIIYRGIIPVLCVIGILGNILNIVVLTHRSWRNSGRLETFAKTGLVALSTADMGVCVSVLPWWFVYTKDPVISTYVSFRIIYTTYSYFVINTFMLTSTLITVSLAFGRFLVIQWPIEMRARINKTCTRGMLACAVLVSIVFNVPRIWNFKINKCHSQQTTSVRYYVTFGHIYDNKAQLLYTCLYFTIATAIPILALCVCNILLIRSIRRSQKYALQYTPSLKHLKRSPSEATQHVSTLVLIAIVLMHILLVTPASLTNFVSQVSNLTRGSLAYTIVVAIVNVLEVCNFSFNFVLYCALNGHFRFLIRQALCRCRNSSFRQANDIPMQEKLYFLSQKTT